MADEKKVKNAPNGNNEGAAQAAKAIRIGAQYVKDLSFENPNAPESLRTSKERPAIDVAIDVRTRQLAENTHEVSLKVTAKATVKDTSLFVAEVDYAGIFQLENIEDAEREGALMIYAPSILFPFVRRIVADTTRDGGFPPLLLEPIDFGVLYHRRKAGKKAA